MKPVLQLNNSYTTLKQYLNKHFVEIKLHEMNNEGTEKIYIYNDKGIYKKLFVVSSNQIFSLTNDKWEYIDEKNSETEQSILKVFLKKSSDDSENVDGFSYIGYFFSNINGDLLQLSYIKECTNKTI